MRIAVRILLWLLSFFIYYSILKLLCTDYNSTYTHSRIIFAGLVPVASMVLGYFLFRRKSYLQRVLLLFPLITCASAFLFFLVDKINYSYSLSEPYNYFTAREDIKQGKIQILTGGVLLGNPIGPNVPVSTLEDEKPDSIIASLYGFKYHYIGCISYPGITQYNDAMQKYLQSKWGKDWHRAFRHKLDSLKRTCLSVSE